MHKKKKELIFFYGKPLHEIKLFVFLKERKKEGEKMVRLPPCITFRKLTTPTKNKTAICGKCNCTPE